MAAGIVKSHIVVQAGIHAAGTQSVGNGPETEHPEGATGGEAKEGGGCHGHADGGDLSGAQFAGEPVAQETGDDRPHGNDHGDHTGIGDGDGKLPVHHRPGRAQKGVRQAEADKGEIDDGKK